MIRAEKSMIITGANEGNLKNISIEIPKDKLVVFTGLSGSGKSTLANDTIYQECQRQYLEAIGYQGIQKPDVESITYLSPAIKISQSETNKNPRSSVGTATNIYTDLRMIYEKISIRTCPNCGEEISSAECKEIFEKNEGDYKVFMICNHCDHKMDKLTRSSFSFNTREGACETCHGFGEVLTINQKNVIDDSLSLEAGAIDYWNQANRIYQIDVLHNTLKHYGILYETGSVVSDFNESQMAMLLYGFESDQIKTKFPNIIPPKNVADGRFEGVYTNLWRRLSEKGGMSKPFEDYFESKICPDCGGERLGLLSRIATIEGKRLPELVVLSLEELYDWIVLLEIKLTGMRYQLVAPYLLDLKTKIQRIMNVGLGYLSIDRQMLTLSGGESQRIKLSATLDSTLTGIIYIMDEPTIGLHPKDTAGVVKILKDLRDLGNTVIIIEHDTDVMRAADFVVDIGPGSGNFGGEIIGKGSLEALMNCETSVTGLFLKKKVAMRESYRKGTGRFVEVNHATLHNLQGIHVKFPEGCLICVTGVSGSGKSTLVFDVLAESIGVTGLEIFDSVITVEQSPLTRMKRSNVATYSGVYSEIRNIFGALNEATSHGLSSKSFSFNSKGGRCENCEGLGYVSSNMLFFENMEVVCPICNGNQFNDDVLSVKYNNHSIKAVLKLSVEEALDVFDKHPKLLKDLLLLKEVGLGYLELGQTLTTLSGGEGQRLKLAKELMNNEGMKNLYLIDEPTTGQHPLDVEHFLVLLNRMVDAGSTVIVVEHNQQIILASDWIVDLGPEGGIHGGQVIAECTPKDLLIHRHSETGKHLELYLNPIIG